MKSLHYIFVVCVTLLMACVWSYAHAQDSVLQLPAPEKTDTVLSSSLGGTTKDYAQQLFKRCQATPSENLPPEDHEEYCACLSAQIYNKSFTDSERSYLATGTGVAVEPQRVATDFFGPCLAAPGRAATYHQCTHTPDIYKYVSNEDALESYCQCVVEKMEFFWGKEAPAYIAMAVRRHPTTLKDDLIRAMMNGRDYPPHYMRSRSQCGRIYGRRD